MKATDLMVGDWVNYKSPSSGKLQPVKIKNIYGVEFNCEVECWNIKSGYSISDTEPIKLTEEILAKNGFQKLNDKTFLLKNQIEIEVGPKFSEVSARYEAHDRMWDSYSNRYIEIAIIHYVHQLQHLLRLAGVQKEIEL